MKKKKSEGWSPSEKFAVIALVGCVALLSFYFLPSMWHRYWDGRAQITAESVILAYNRAKKDGVEVTGSVSDKVRAVMDPEGSIAKQKDSAGKSRRSYATDMSHLPRAFKYIFLDSKSGELRFDYYGKQDPTGGNK